jgi:hypothetical protein
VRLVANRLPAEPCTPKAKEKNPANSLSQHGFFGCGDRI